MATIVAAAGGGNWTVGATWTGGVAPSAADDAQLTVASGNVTVDTGAVARSLDCTGYTGTLTHTAGVNLSLGDATAGAGNVALKFVAGMTYTAASPSTSFLTFVSTSATQQTIDSAGKALTAWTINGAGSSYILTSGVTINTGAMFTLTAGTFNTGSFAVSTGLMLIQGATAKTLTLGSSAIAITGNSASTAVFYSGSNATVTANTAVMTFSGATAGFNGALNWNGTSLVFSNTVGAPSLLNGPTLNNVTYTGPANKTSSFTVANATPTITGTLTITGNSTINRILMLSAIVGTTRTVTVGTGFSFTNVDFSDITAAGAAGTWTGTSMGNALGNTNITFDAPATQTHTATAGGNWSDVTKWTSRVPLPQDNVVVDVNTTGTLTADMPRLGADVTFTGFTGTASFASTANTMYGSLVLGAGMTVSGTQALTLAARTSKTITSNTKNFTQGINVTAPSGTYTLTDAISSDATLNVIAGTFVSSSFAVTVNAFVAQTGNATLGSSVVTLNRTTVGSSLDVTGAGTLSAASATFVVSVLSANGRTFAGGGKSFGTLTYTVAGSTGSLTITGANTFNTINFSDATNGRSLLFTAGTNTTITNNWNVFGTAGKLMTVDSATAATHTLTKPTGTVSTDYLSIKNSLAGGGAYWYAGANSVDAGGNSGWKFSAPPTDGATQFFFALDNAGGGGAQ